MISTGNSNGRLLVHFSRTLLGLSVESDNVFYNTTEYFFFIIANVVWGGPPHAHPRSPFPVILTSTSLTPEIHAPLSKTRSILILADHSWHHRAF